jgi:hypothetical protein
VHLTAGSDHTCALLDDGSVKCWGQNGDGRLGLGDVEARGDEPGEMGDALPSVSIGAILEPVSRIGAGNFHTCMIAGTLLKCWGVNATGQLGMGHTETRGDGPGDMGVALTNVDTGTALTPTQVDGGAYFTCARFSNQRIKCWGANDAGQLGYGDRIIRGMDPDDMGDALPFVDLGRD